MPENFFEKPILNSPYNYPGRHWELDSDGQPTNRITEKRRECSYITPVPKPKKKKAKEETPDLFGGPKGISVDGELYDPTSIINEMRGYIDRWRKLPNPKDWGVTPETQRLLQHWRHHPFEGVRPFFCQIEAVETAIWLAEVAPKLEQGKKFRRYLEAANADANPELFRIALKLATGAGKTTVMALLIAWQTVNAVRHPSSKLYSRGFLIVTPGITIKDRLRVLLPSDMESYYASREIVPRDMLGDIAKAKIVITNYHAFKLRERINLSAGGKSLLQGRGPELQTKETEGQMVQRVMGELMGMKNVVVLNDEAHHCYRERVGADAEDTEEDLKGDEKADAQQQNAAARLWISGIEAVKRKLGVRIVYDLSATPFFLAGSGYREGTLFPWVMSDFSLMDAIECGIVKLPRIPIADNVPGEEMPMLRNLWEHIGKSMPKGRRGAKNLDPLSLPPKLTTALDALYGHYKKTYDLWADRGISVPPVFIVVCNNTSSSKLVYDYISGFEREESGKTSFHEGRLELFRNYDEHGQPHARPRTLLIDSVQLESGDSLDSNFHEVAADEIAQFRREIVERTGDQEAGRNLSDQDLLREVMNTVGKKGRLGESIRCVVSVSMLTEGWDANTVTHILGVRAFGTQLLCEQVVGRGLRRQSYELNSEGLFDVEYSDILGIPFDFTAKPVVANPKPPKETVRVHAVRPDRDALEITFPRVQGYRTELPSERLSAKFNDDHILVLDPKLVGSTTVLNSGIIGEQIDLTLDHLAEVRKSTVIYELTSHLLFTKFRDPGEEPKMHLFGQLKRIVREWLDGGYLKLVGGTQLAQIKYKALTDMACERIRKAITDAHIGENKILAIIDPFNPIGSTSSVNFNTSKDTYATNHDRSHVNYVVTDSDWEAEFARVAESRKEVLYYVKNQGLGLEVPYLMGADTHRYIPDFLLRIDDGKGPDNPLNLVIEIKGYRGEDAKEKASTMRSYWIPGVNNLGIYGRWAFAEFTEVFAMEKDFEKLLQDKFDQAFAAAGEGETQNLIV
ncbi:BPTD_3080 family restriction endonuclease [Luteolibacter soli]|uniref:DEAD/DEAH box helicase family protein n=1 Tax=Luteolibacter soli TaxID=3135280 RepID=A0ABU9AUX8_9BACT